MKLSEAWSIECGEMPTMVEGLLDDPELVPEIERPTGNDRLLADYRAGVSRMADILNNADQTAPLWTWSHEKDVAFVTRHQVQEAAVHGGLPGTSR